MWDSVLLVFQVFKFFKSYMNCRELLYKNNLNTNAERYVSFEPPGVMHKSVGLVQVLTHYLIPFSCKLLSEGIK